MWRRALFGLAVRESITMTLRKVLRWRVEPCLCRRETGDGKDTEGQGRDEQAECPTLALIKSDYTGTYH
jgi:hypothetical protein